MMAGCQEGRSPSMLAAHNCIYILLAFNTNKEKERKKKTERQKTDRLTKATVVKDNVTKITTNGSINSMHQRNIKLHLSYLL